MKGYKINFAKGTVTVTKKFMEDAGVINSSAFNEMKELRKLGFAIVERETKPRKRNTLTYAQMIQYIALVENSEFYMKRFNAIRAEANSKNDRYNRVLKWFRETFPNFYAMPDFNADNKIIVTSSGRLTQENDVPMSKQEGKVAKLGKKTNEEPSFSLAS